MKKTSSKKIPAKKLEKGKESGELRKPAKLKPLKEKEKKSWKNNLDEEEDDLEIGANDDIGLNNFDEADDEEDDFYNNNY